MLTLNAMHQLHAHEVSHRIMSNPSLEEALQKLDDKQLVGELARNANPIDSEDMFFDICRAEFEAQLPRPATEALRSFGILSVSDLDDRKKGQAFIAIINMPLTEFKDVLNAIRIRREQHAQQLAKTNARKSRRRQPLSRFFSLRPSVRGGCGAYA